MTSQFKQRMLISIFAIVLIVVSIYYSFVPAFKPFFVFLNALIVGLALREYYRLAIYKGFQPLTLLGIGCSIVYLFALAYSLGHPSLEALPSLILLATLLLFFVTFFNQQSASLGNLAVTAFAFIYLVIPLSCALRINYFFPHQEGSVWLAYVLFVSKITDVGAYFCGKLYGKTRLAPLISPKKTIEGALGGLAAALIASLLFALISAFHDFGGTFILTAWQSIWIGLLISVLAQLGDLAESLLKRDAGVKDSSRLPGLGGILDIVDSLIFTLPLIYLLLYMFHNVKMME